jgi:hypothetical protein
MNSPSTAPPDTFEARRAQWGAVGIAADQRLHQQAVIAAILLGCAFLTAVAVVLYVG